MHPERALAEQCYKIAEDHLDDVDGMRSGTPEELSSLGAAQVELLKAIYYEMRHGNDLAAAAAAAHAKALDEHADAMDHLGADMRGLGDALDRHR